MAVESSPPPAVFLSLLQFAAGEVAFISIFALIIQSATARATTQRVLGLAILVALTSSLERLIVWMCLANGRPHWAATTASLLWVQLLSASELLLVSRVDASHLPCHDRLDEKDGVTNTSLFGPAAAASAVGLLWNMRRIGTRWQVKNVTVVNSTQQQQSRTAFITSRVVLTTAAYLFVDVVVSMPPPEQALVQPDKTTLFALQNLDTGDLVFRFAMTVSYFLTTGVLNLFMTNMGALAAVLLHFSSPADCPSLYGSFSEAFTVRRFWGVTWHQMFRSFLTGHAGLIVDNTLPFVPRHSVVSRYVRLTIAFFISGAIHYRAEQLQGVPASENGAVAFFLMQAAAIMFEDAVAPIMAIVVPWPRVRRVLGWVWVLLFLIWASPIWTYPSTRLGNDSAALLPIRLVGPWLLRKTTLKAGGTRTAFK